MKRGIVLIPVILTLFYFTGCTSSGSKKSYGSDIGKEYRLNDIWVLQNLGGTDVKDSDFSVGLPDMEIKINSMVFSGSTGCNRMQGIVAATTETIEFSNIATTEVACPGDYEQKFLDALKRTDTYLIENNRLFLMYGTVVLLVFKKVD